MDIFKIQRGIIEEYESYIKSFINIRNEKIRGVVEKELEEKKLWPSPLIQFNPNYEKGDSVDNLINSGILAPESGNIFKGYELYKHQVEAIKLGISGKDFVVTSGTGSGKSLIYLATIFDYVLKNIDKCKGLTAIIVYPMNALINSQTEEIKKFKDNYEKNSGEEFPVTFGQYTGQERTEERERLKKNPPHILLTNYMMLELIMTRSGEKVFRESISEFLKFLIFDELHTYRGRQGADVSMLIRRIKTYAKNKIMCMGTSATMISGENTTFKEQKVLVAKFAQKIFGSPFTDTQIINEYLQPSLTTGKEITKEEITNALQNEINVNADEDEFIKNPLVNWIENLIALEKKEGVYVRRKSLRFKDIITELSEFVETDIEVCKAQLKKIFEWSVNLNAKNNRTKIFLPYKLHQFISQTGTVYTTLDKDDKQYITLNPGVYVNIDDKKKILFPVVFSRISGAEFICVYKNITNSKLEPREFRMTVSEEDEEDLESGYIIPDFDCWNPETDIENLPESYFQTDRNGIRKLKKNYKNRIPKKIYYNELGNYSEKPDFKFKGWYMPANLLFDPTSGTFFDTKTNEGTKLTKLGTEGRSTSTTVLSLAILKKLADNGYSKEDQKLLSFTDNRQDAELQSGHFNDFLDVIKLRSSLHHTLRNNSGRILDHTNIATEIFKFLSLKQDEYASSPSDFPGTVKDNEDALKDYIMYRILYDLRRGWRVILPNLEQCALLEIYYRHLKENCEIETAWKDIPFVCDLTVDERIDFIRSILDYFRQEYAIHSENYLSRAAIESKAKNIKERLKPPWTFEKEEEINVPNYLRLETLPERVRIFHKSAGLQSSLGKFIRNEARKKEVILNRENYTEFMTSLFELMRNAGWLYREEINAGNDEYVNVYQINIDKIIWKLGDEKTVRPDKIKMRSYKEKDLKPNIYFQNIYKINFKDYKKFEGNVHTGQDSIDDRRKREQKFRDGNISALYCSPTMELGIDISTLNVVHMRNAPPNPSNYAQRSGRAGRNGQAALIFTYCSGFSPHDVHYFKNSTALVSGSVVPPRIELCNEELIRTHLNAMYLSDLQLQEINESIAEIINEQDTEKLPLKDSIEFDLKPHEKQPLKNKFKEILKDFEPELLKGNWYNNEWIEININNFKTALNESLNRWRTLYKAAIIQLSKAQDIIKSGLYGTSSPEMKAAFRNEKQAARQIEMLKNSYVPSANANTSNISEFYPFRYLASEGFLPGYNFTRLPIRTFIPEGDSGVYISRPRFIALREFGPANTIYHNSKKYQVKQILTPDLENNIKGAKVVKNSGYFLEGEDMNLEKCPLTDVVLDANNIEGYNNVLIEMSETRTEEQMHITCEEEERIRHGYEIKTYFSVPAGVDTIKHAIVKNDEDGFLNISYIPAAKLVQVNNKWKNSHQQGFLMGMTSGQWKKITQIKDSKEFNKSVKIFTHDTADSLYIEPIKALGLIPDGVITLQFALKRAIENLFQIESNEIGVTSIGDPATPNIFIYEASEGSLGILSQFVNEPEIFNKVIVEAIKVCRYDDDTYKDPASYDDLLSYYNQQYHLRIDRFTIKDALEKLKVCNIEILTSEYGEDYENHYQRILSQIDKNSITELKFLEYLYKNGLRLPDEAQKRTEGIYSQPDFFYKPDIHIFCDGTPHDDSIVKENDIKIRNAIRNRGEQVIVYYYKEKLEDVISKRPDIFKKIR